MKNELMFGVVVEQDTKTLRVRVKFPDHDSMVSWWLPVIQRKTKADKLYQIPDIGEHVSCIMDDKLEVGVVLGAIYSKKHSVPVVSAEKDQVKYKDGTVKEYDRQEHKDDISYMDNALFSYDAENHKHYFNYMDGASATYQAEYWKNEGEDDEEFIPGRYKFHQADGAEIEYTAEYQNEEKEIDIESNLRITLPGALINMTFNGTTGILTINGTTINLLATENINIVADGDVTISGDTVTIENCDCQS